MAGAPNVTMKISGLGMCDPALDGRSRSGPTCWAASRPSASDRVVFGTNWPVDRMYSSYPDVINAYAEIISGFHATTSRRRCFPATPNGCSGSEAGQTMAETRAAVDRRPPRRHDASRASRPALAFWEAFLGKPARWTTVLDRPYLGRIVGYPGVAIKAAFVDLPGGVVLELLDYHRSPGAVANPEATANPGNMHLCLARRGCRTRRGNTRSPAARVPVSPDGPVEVDGGPNNGAKAAYLRIHDGITLELFQPPPRREAAG